MHSDGGTPRHGESILIGEERREALLDEIPPALLLLHRAAEHAPGRNPPLDDTQRDEEANEPDDPKDEDLQHSFFTVTRTRHCEKRCRGAMASAGTV